MVKNNRLLLFLLCVFLLNLPDSCYKVVKVEPTPEPTPTPPNAYQASIRVDQAGECNLGDKTIFELKPDGSFTYLNNVYISKNRVFEAPETIKLSANEISALQNMLNEIDIDELAKKDVPVPAGSPQTKECRAVDNFTLKFNDQQKVFDRNSRLLIHSPEYNEAINKLKEKLESFKKPAEIQIFPYDFPIIVTATDECNPHNPPKVLFNVADNGDFTYLVTDAKGERTVRKKVTQEDISALRNILDEINLAPRAEAENVPYVENKENASCRVIETTMIMYNSREEFYDRNGRRFVHSQEYLDALDKLKMALEELKNK
jgi:hypothetical protein